MKIAVFLENNHLRYEISQNKTKNTWIHPLDLNRVQSLCKTFVSKARLQVRPDGSSSDSFRELETLSRALSRLMLPDELLGILQQNEAFLQLQVDPQLEFIPWEWLHDGGDFWIRKHFPGRMDTRLPDIAPRPPVRPVRMLVVVSNPDRDLPHALPEARKLVRELDRERAYAARLVVNPRVDELIRSLNTADIVHYIGHMVSTPAPQGQVPAWKLSDGVFGPAEIDTALFGGARLRLVFSNACPGTQPDAAGAMLFPRALRKAGVACVVSSIVDVPDRTAAEISAGFYHDLAAGRRIGEALALARERARSRLGMHDITWMVHILHGNPETVLLPAPEASAGHARLAQAGSVPYKRPLASRPPGTLGRKLEIALLILLAAATGYQLLAPTFHRREAFTPIRMETPDVSGRMVFTGFSTGGAAAQDDVLEAEQCFLRALTTLPEIRLEDARSVAFSLHGSPHLEITGRVVNAASGNAKVLLWVRRISDRVILYADDFPLPLPDEMPCVRLQDWIRQHRGR